MAKVKFQNTNFSLNTSDFFKDKRSTSKISKAIRSELVDNFRSGTGANDKPFPALEDTKHRKYIAKNNTTHKDFRLNKSNITITGRFVRSLKVNFKKFVRLKNKREARYGLSFTGKHRRYKSNKNKPIGKKAANNSDIADNLDDLGYELYGITKKAQDRIFKVYKAWIRRNLRLISSRGKRK